MADVGIPPHSYVVVYSTSQALKLEKLLMRVGILCKLIPVLRHISSDCGVCVRIVQADETHAQQVVCESRIEIQGFFPVKGNAQISAGVIVCWFIPA